MTEKTELLRGGALLETIGAMPTVWGEFIGLENIYRAWIDFSRGNVYLHGLDMFVKHRLKQRHYFRYADDFICLVEGREMAEQFVVDVGRWLYGAVQLELHPKKIIVRPTGWGIDWLGEVLLPGSRVLRPSTRRRMMHKISVAVTEPTSDVELQGMLASYSGLLKPVAHREAMQDIRQLVALRGLL